jgi:hypothetical protein
VMLQRRKEEPGDETRDKEEDKKRNVRFLRSSSSAVLPAGFLSSRK